MSIPIESLLPEAGRSATPHPAAQHGHLERQLIVRYLRRLSGQAQTADHPMIATYLMVLADRIAEGEHVVQSGESTDLPGH